MPLGPFTKFQDIPQFTRDANYRVNQSWNYLQDWLDRQIEEELDISPPWQRAHVWNNDQRSRYVEFILRGGRSGRDLYFNHPGWMGSFKGEFVLVDGKQRLSAVCKFLNNEIPAFGTLYKDYEDKLPFMHVDFVININTLQTRAEVLNWYIDLNRGGTPHTDEEIEKVEKMLLQEETKLKRKKGG